MQPAADSTWFTFTCSGGAFAVYGFSGREAVSEAYEFSIELVSLSSGEDITGLVGTEGCLAVADRSGATRLVHGVIRQMEQLHTGNLRTHYRAVLVPRLWFLKETCNHRIFQEMTVEDIISQVLREQGFSGSGFSSKCAGSGEPREYCVQYGESDFHFINRLCEEEGIYYYFEHSAGGHCLCFSNMPGGPPIEGESALRYFPGSGQVSDTAVISRLNVHSRSNSDTATYRDWNFEKPNLDLLAARNESDPEKAPAPPGMKLESYRYPHIYSEKGAGETYAETQLLRQLTFARWVSGESEVARLTPGFSFTVAQHPSPDANAEWWTVSVEHYGEQPGVLEHEAPSERGLHYSCSFSAIPSMTRFVPPLRHPKNRVPGDQTAIVTGPEGEEIYPDKYGRVKVQFFWDRRDLWNENTTCWIRVSQGWAGPGYGIMAVPRIGHEVIVSFLEGDPDRPIITGRVFHALNMPPYELPDHKTRTVFKSMSTPGEENEERGFNEFRIEDKKGEEEIYIHAEKDVNIHVKNDWKEHILHDHHRTVENASFTRIKGEDHWIIEQPRKVELLAEDHLTVKGDSHSEYETKWLAKVGEELHFKAGDKVVIEAGSDLTVKGGGAFIRLTPAGIVIQGGSVRINEGGSPGSGSGAAPETPDEAVGVDAAGNPIAPERKKGEEVVTGANAGATAGKVEHEDGRRGGDKRCYPVGPITPEDILTPAASYKQMAEKLLAARVDASQLSGGGELSSLQKQVSAEWSSHLDMVNAETNLSDKIKRAHTLASRYKYISDPVSQPMVKAMRDGKPVIISLKGTAKERDVWSPPTQFYSLKALPGDLYSPPGRDCEDYALLQYCLLEQAGVPAENMRIKVLKPLSPDGIWHAVLEVDDPRQGRSYIVDGTRRGNTGISQTIDPAYTPAADIGHDEICEY